MHRNLTFSLCYNLVSEVADSLERLYKQNSNLEHLIVDCGFPLISDEIPDDIEKAKEFNTERLIAMSNNYGCDYVRIENRGISQNYNQIIEYLEPHETDILVCADADEKPVESGWVKAICDVLRAGDNSGYCASLLMDAKPILDKNIPVKQVGEHFVYDMNYASINYGLVGIKASFLKKIGEVPVPPTMQVYGGLEAMLLQKLQQHKMSWYVLRDFTQVHTNDCKLYREWKNDCIFTQTGNGQPQIDFEQWLKNKKVMA